MGAKEDAVRQRLARDRQTALAIERAKKEKFRTLQAKLNASLEEIEQEQERVAQLAEDADWSHAELWSFRIVREHWWQLSHSDEMAVLVIACPRSHVDKLWLRSDGILFMRYRLQPGLPNRGLRTRGVLWAFRNQCWWRLFGYPEDSTAARQHAIRRAQDVLDALRRIKSIS